MSSAQGQDLLVALVSFIQPIIRAYAPVTGEMGQSGLYACLIFMYYTDSLVDHDNGTELLWKERNSH